MSIRKKKKKINILPLLLAFQMFLPSQLLAQTDAARESQAFSNTGQVLNVANQLGQQLIQSQQARMQQEQAQARAQQLQQSLGVQPADPNQIPPILTQNGCVVLGAKTDQISSGLRCEGGIDPALYNQGHYTALMTVAEQNVTKLDDFLTEGHERFTAQGKGCYQKARNQLTTQLEAREEMLTQMKASIAKRVALFKAATEKDLKDIKKGQALLDGPKNMDAETQALMKDFKFEDKFNDPQCKSLMSDFAKDGQNGGFRQIEEALGLNKESLGAETFFAKKNQIEREIRAIAREAYKQASDVGETPQAQDVLGGIRTREFAPTSQALTQSFGIALKRVEERRNELNKELASVIGNNEQFAGLAQQVQTGQANLDQRLSEYQRDVTNSCFNNHFNQEFGSIDSFVSRLEDPNISRKANREGDSAFKNYVEKILSDNRYTVEEKMEMISRKQREGNNSRYGLVSDRSFTVKGQPVGASTRLRGSDMVTLFAQDCMEGFEQDDLGNGHSGRDIVRAMRNYEQEIKQSQREFATNLQEEILQGLTDCPEDNSTGSGAKTCSAATMKPNDGPFCVRTANACAANAVGCHDKAQKIVETTRKEQKAIATRYKANMDKLKLDLIAEFETVNQGLEQSSRMIDGMFQFGTVFQAANVPPIDFTTEELLAGINDPSLAIEDPEKYKEKVFKNIDLVEKQLDQHKEDLVTAFDDEIAKYERNYNQQLQEWEGILNSCQSQVAAYENDLRQQDQQNREMASQDNEELLQACRKFDQFRTNPCPTSGNEFGSLAEDIGAIAATSGASSSEIYDILDQCDAANNENGGHQFFDDGSGGASRSNPRLSMDLDQFCGVSGSGDSPGAQFDECDRYKSHRNRTPTCSRGDYTTLLTNYKRDNNQVFCRKVTQIAPKDSCEGDWIPVADATAIADDGVQAILASTSSSCSYRSEDDTGNSAVAEAQELLNQYKRQAQINDLRDRAGEVRVAACEGGNNSGPGMPDMFNPGQQRGVAGDMFGAGALGF